MGTEDKISDHPQGKWDYGSDEVIPTGKLDSSPFLHLPFDTIGSSRKLFGKCLLIDLAIGIRKD